MKKKTDKRTLPRFLAVTLGPDELSRAAGGYYNTDVTRCHSAIDGVMDTDT